MENKSNLFTMGPIPYLWSYRANKLGAATGIIAQSLWFYVGINGSYTFKVDRNIDLLSGLTRQTRQSCLKRLHVAGLIQLASLKGAYPIVTILNAGQAGRRNQALITTTLETKTFDASTKASSGANFRKRHILKQGYSPYQQMEFRFDENN
jgi:hypothetical protein